MFKCILVGIDGSPQSLRAAETAGEMARAMHSDVFMVVAYDPIPSNLGEPFLHDIIAANIAAAEETYKAAAEACGEIPGRLIKEILSGPPAEAILSVAETRGADLIVMGTRGLGTIASLFLGSQSIKVISQARCPVLLVR